MRKSNHKIQFCSDLHLDMPANAKFVEENPIAAYGDILIIAGDLIQLDGLANKYLKWLIARLCRGFEKVFWLPGNHDITTLYTVERGIFRYMKNLSERLKIWYWWTIILKP